MQSSLLALSPVLSHAFLAVTYTNVRATILLVQHIQVVGVRLAAAQRAARDPRAQPLDRVMRLGSGQKLPRPADLVARRFG